jgi:hypothetical protein
MRSMTDGWSSNPRSFTSPEISSWRIVEYPSGQHEAGKAAESSVCLEQHFYALVRTNVVDIEDLSRRIPRR